MTRDARAFAALSHRNELGLGLSLGLRPSESHAQLRATNFKGGGHFYPW